MGAQTSGITVFFKGDMSSLRGAHREAKSHRRELKEKEIGKKGEKRTEQAVSWYGQKKLVQTYQEKRHAKALA